MINLLDSWRNHRRVARTRQTLNSLSDQMLNDIGVCRSDIPNIGRRGFDPRFER